MRGKNTGALDKFYRFIKSLALLDKLSCAFQRQKGRMPLVHVINAWVVPQSFQRAEAADAQQDLLGNAQLWVTDVEPISQLAVIGVILRDVGLHKHQFHAANIELIQASVDCPAWQLHRNLDGFMVCIIERNER